MADNSDEQQGHPQEPWRSILERHRIWVDSQEKEGERGVFFGMGLVEADLVRENLSHANFIRADLSMAHLRLANLSTADLRDASLCLADLSLANLSHAVLLRANLSRANLGGADLSEAVLSEASLESADLREASGVRLDKTYIRGAQFSPVTARWRAFLHRNGLLRQTRPPRWSEEWSGRKPGDNDPWSVLRQIYSGPRALFLFFFVVVFALPYVGRAAFYSTASAAEQRVIDSWTHQKDHWQEPHRAVGGPAAELIATPFDGAERFVRRNSQPRPLWQVLLKLDEGRILPSVLAVLLVLYNVGVYWLITAVGPLRDEEERSGWSPAWKDYGYLRWVHRVVTALFYVSFAAFAWNVVGLLRQTVWVPAGG